MKQCKVCEQQKPLSSFYERKPGKYDLVCNQCRAIKNRQYQKPSKEYSNERSKRYAVKIREKYGIGMRTVATFGLKLALEVYDRSGRKCEECGEVNDLTIHHIDGNGRHNQEKGLPMNNDADNLKVLCRSCHGRIHGKQGAEKRRLSCE
jgi:hypothetical protein